MFVPHFPAVAQGLNVCNVFCSTRGNLNPGACLPPRIVIPQVLHTLRLSQSVQDKDGEPVGIDSLRIMRSHLRRTLLSRVPSDLVHFSKVCTSAEPASQPGQPVQMTFADGSTEECDLLVVAEGANSRLRAALLPHEVNRYAGVCMLFVSPSPWQPCIHCWLYNVCCTRPKFRLRFGLLHYFLQYSWQNRPGACVANIVIHVSDVKLMPDLARAS